MSNTVSGAESGAQVYETGGAKANFLLTLLCFTSIVFHLRSSLAFRGLPQEDRLSFLRRKRQSRWFSLFNKSKKH